MWQGWCVYEYSRPYKAARQAKELGRFALTGQEQPVTVHLSGCNHQDEGLGIFTASLPKGEALAPQGEEWGSATKKAPSHFHSELLEVQMALKL